MLAFEFLFCRRGCAVSADLVDGDDGCQCRVDGRAH